MFCWPFCSGSTSSSKKYWRFDADVTKPLPSNFRMITFKDGTGISASGQFGVDGLSQIQNCLEGKSIRVVDLRMEAHTLVNGQPVTYHHAEEKEMQEALKSLRELAILSCYRGDGSLNVVTVGDVVSEEELLASKQIPYERLQVKDGTVAKDDIIDRLIQICLDAKTKKQWLHIHCRLGEGRTSFAVAIIMMMEFAKIHSSKEILTMSCQLGGFNFLNEKPDSRCPPRYFWTNFHTYCKQERYRQVRWSAWSVGDQL